ncbi:hypothetical protein RO3G_09862 [Rhizopus delemar RA 99-880]|uniref:Uncharacterized protein n=1 Tax=Rhizopus delemar (strain RA 99-880 / ATCC MYA-4621 / FGSC 9543 / NRRL 43880) TaxID=246409 RepID=I1C9M2_RHIO9|nr:hypothetical protein RO3G_09862 [Rhizopus delemar RA 99-880]|eukprot:EIE85152.1 hypothetical protein RO3G_09862 [Rhizopus delemar RA 99-880]
MQVNPTLQDCEYSTVPMLDYLERNLKILNDNLSETRYRCCSIEFSYAELQKCNYPTPAKKQEVVPDALIPTNDLTLVNENIKNRQQEKKIFVI